MSIEQALGQRVEELERRLRRMQMMVLLVAVAAGALIAAACTQLNAQPAGDGILRARGIVITDAKGVERIHIGSPVPSPPGEAGARISPATGMMIHDENGRERFGVGYREDGWTVIGFDAAPGTGTGNRERLHLGVEANGRAFIRFLDQTGGLAGRLHQTVEDRVALEFWKGDAVTRSFQRSTVDLDGWRKLPDYQVQGQSR